MGKIVFHFSDDQSSVEASNLLRYGTKTPTKNNNNNNNNNSNNSNNDNNHYKQYQTYQRNYRLKKIRETNQKFKEDFIKWKLVNNLQ